MTRATKSRTQIGVRLDAAMTEHLAILRTAWVGPTGAPDDSAIMREALRRAAMAESGKKPKNRYTTLDIV